jgi:hypothetical protein
LSSSRRHRDGDGDSSTSEAVERSELHHTPSPLPMIDDLPISN